MRVDVEHGVRLEVERMAAVGHDLVLVLGRGDRHAVGRFGEQVDRRRGIEGEHAGVDRCGKARRRLAECQDQIDFPRRHREQFPSRRGEAEAEELAREREIFLQQGEAAEQPGVVGQERLVVAEADLLDPRAAHVDEPGIAERIEVTQMDAGSAAEYLLVEHRRVGLRADEMDRKGGDRAAAKQARRIFARCLIRHFVLDALGGPQPQGEAQAGAKIAFQAQRMQWSRSRVILGPGQLEGPDGEVAAQRVSAGDVLVSLAVDRVEEGAALDGAALAQGRIAEDGLDLGKHGRRRGRKKARQQLLDQIVGELGKLVLDLELHARREERRTLQEGREHGIGAVMRHAAEAVGDARIFLCELLRMFVEQRQFPVIEVDEFAMHGDSVGRCRLLERGVAGQEWAPRRLISCDGASPLTFFRSASCRYRSRCPRRTRRRRRPDRISSRPRPQKRTLRE